jgi:diguanylate cyclase (GGDEF)-like protein/PAS domain S-box-containing protein
MGAFRESGRRGSLEPGAREADAAVSHWHVAPASLIILAFVGSGLAPGSLVSWAWIGGLALNVIARLAIPAPGPEAPRAARDAAVRWRALSFLVDALLWGGLVMSIDPLPGPLAARVGGALAAAMLISSLSSASRSTPLGLLLFWSIPTAAMATHASSGPIIAVGLLLWVASVVWLGATRPTASSARAVRFEPAAGVSSGSTRKGVQLAVQASSAPMIAVYNGYVFEINAPAAALLGLLTFDCIGRRIRDLVTFDPTDALAEAQRAGRAPEAVSLRPAHAPEAEAIGVRIRMGHSRSQEPIFVLALQDGRPAPVRPSAGAEAAAASEEALVPSLHGIQVIEAHPEALPEARARIAPLDLELSQPAAEPAMPAALASAPPSAAPAPEAAAHRVTPSPVAAAVGTTVAPHGAAAQERAPLGPLPDVLKQLPVLAWVVDSEGRVLHTHSEEVRRWGMKIAAAMKPRWWDAFVYRARSREAVLGALQSAVQGRPTYDLFVERASHTGGRLALRCHVVPVQWPDSGGEQRPSALVLDTIASARELLEYERLYQRKEHYKSLVEASPNLIWSIDSNFRFTFVSRRACRELYGYAVEDLVGVSIGVLLNPAADQTTARRALVALRDGHVMRDVEMAHVTKDGRGITVAVSAVALAGMNRDFTGAVGMMVDLTALKEREASLAEALHVERTVLNSAGQALAVVRDGIVARCNEAFLQLLGRSPGQMEGLGLAEVFADRVEWSNAMTDADRAKLSDQAVVREMKFWRIEPGVSEPQAHWCQLTLRAVEPGEYVVALADIDSLRRREAHALFDARHDELTGLANRRLFSERARAALATSALRNSGCAIVVIDLDGFKQINDRYGHLAGDEVLQQMAHRLQRAVRPPDTVARYGGDEFALLIPDAGTRRDIAAIASRILEELARPVPIAGRGEQRLSASMGIAMASETRSDPIALLSMADRAMYEAKSGGGNRAVFASSPEPPALLASEVPGPGLQSSAPVTGIGRAA